jgi:bifunctional UDP-N-acetylglucosamine pyrophosphorylase/glucosamine-1-phosphate N-acetyltransferase
LVDTQLGDQVTIHNHSELQSSFVDGHARVGPYAYARPGTTIGENAKFGSFVEAKNTQIMPGASVAHFAYVGDCQVGKEANIGAFVVHCNYHGPGKPKAYSSIGDHAFVGAGTQIVGPAELGKVCIIGAGSTVRGNVDDYELYVDKKSPIRKDNWGNNNKPSANSVDSHEEANTLNAQTLKI